MPEKFNPLYDLESLTESQRQQYVSALCHHIGVPDNLNLVALTYLDETEGPARLVPYIKRGGAEMIRQSIGLDVKSLTDKMVGGSIVFTATGINKDGRQEIAVGSKFVDGLIGNALDDAVMTASTRALRRLALQFIGAGVLDESEVNQRKTIHVSAVPVPAQPIAEPGNTPGKDVTPDLLPTSEIIPSLKVSEPIVTLIDETKRLEAITQLNAQVEPVKKTRKPRGPNKKKVDLGPSEPAATLEAVKPAEPELTPPTIPIAPTVAAPAVQAAAVTAPGVQSKPKLTADQVKPFRQRLFRLQNDYLEPNGFAPTEGMGNAQKMRAFAQVMFADIVSMNDLSVEQWEKYLSTLENKVESQGPVATIKFIEETIGL